jgi:hypothetical protein|tara:strand:+ start:223 stop:777 length:555 start_codon:yes stop_codon:yes gene_type:complete
MNKHQRNLKSATSMHYNSFYNRKTLGDKNTSAYKNLDKLIKPRSKYTVNDLLKELTNVRKQRQILKSSIIHQKKRADKWAEKHNKDLKHYNQLLIDNEQLKKTNEELNLMHHQALIKILNLGQEMRNNPNDLANQILKKVKEMLEINTRVNWDGQWMEKQPVTPNEEFQNVLDEIKKMEKGKKI